MIKVKKYPIIIIVVIVFFGIVFFITNLSKELKPEQKIISKKEKTNVLNSLASSILPISIKEKKEILEKIGRKSNNNKHLSPEEKIKILNSLTK